MEIAEVIAGGRAGREPHRADGIELIQRRASEVVE
jgi:hypothetical protein